ncbi:MAG: 50S ribosomal protein L34 [Candidatus Moraniibacteriota bacterium]
MSETYQPKSLRRVKRHGFRKRNSTASGQNVLKARRRSGRAKLTTV